MRWEYKTIELKRNFLFGSINAEALQVQLNEFGRDGWELVSLHQGPSTYAVAVLERSK